MTKSHVSLEQHRCRICGKDFDTGAILLDRRLKASMEMVTMTGAGICPEDQSMIDSGYIALVEIDPVKSHADPGKPVKEGNAYRTGRLAWMALHAVKPVLGIYPYDDTGTPLPFVFVEDGVVEKLQEMIPTKEVSENDPSTVN